MGNKFLAALEKGFPVHHNHTAAGIAADFDISAGTDDGPQITAAGVLFAGADNVAGQNDFDSSCFRHGFLRTAGGINRASPL